MTSDAPLLPGSPQWWAARAPAPSNRRGRPPMDLARIVAAALKLIDEVGVQALTLRMLAESIDSGTATLYRHMRGKNDLLALVADSLLGEVNLAPEVTADLSWRDAIEVAAGALYDTLNLHPNAVPLLATQVPVGPNGLLVREWVIGLLMSHGFSAELAARAFTAVGHYVIGFAIQQTSAPLAADRAALRKYYRSLDATRYAATRAAAKALTSVPAHEEFRFGLNLLLDGLERTLST